MSLRWREFRREMHGNRVAPFEPPNLKDDSALSWLEGYEAIRDELDPELFSKCIDSIPGYEARIILSELWDSEDERDGWMQRADENPDEADYALAKASAAESAGRAIYDKNRIELAKVLAKHQELGGKISLSYIPEFRKLDSDGVLTRLSGVDIQGLDSSPFKFAYTRAARDRERARNHAMYGYSGHKSAQRVAQVDVSRYAKPKNETGPEKQSAQLSSQLREQAQATVSAPGPEPIAVEQHKFDPNGPKDVANGLAEVREYFAQKVKKAAEARSGKYVGPSFSIGTGEEGLQK